MWLFRLLRKCFKYLKKNIEYVILFVVLFFIIWLTLYLFIDKEIVTDAQAKATYVISILGFSFALFQFIFNEITTKKRRFYDIHYSAYKEITILIDALCETLDLQLTASRMLKVKDLVATLINQTVKINSLLYKDTFHFFPKVALTAESIKIQETIQKILERTFEYSQAIDKCDNMNIAESTSIKTKEQSDYYDDMITYWKELRDDKTVLYAKFREYLN